MKPGFLLRRARALHDEGLRHRDANELAQAHSAFEAERALLESLPADDVDDLGLGMVLHELGWLAFKAGDNATALALYERARAKKEKVPAERERWNDYATTLHEIGIVLGRLGRADEAVVAYEDALAANANVSDIAVRDNADRTTLHALLLAHRRRDDWTAVRATALRWPSSSSSQAALSARVFYWLTFACIELEQWKEASTAAAESQRLYALAPVD